MAFIAIKEALANVAPLYHPKSDAVTSLMTDASDVAVGAVLQQQVGEEVQPIGTALSTGSCSQCIWLSSTSVTLWKVAVSTF